MSVHPVLLLLAGSLLVGTLLLLALRPFERTVGLRYLSRSFPSRHVRGLLFGSLLIAAAGAAMLGLGRGAWLVELVGAGLLFVAAVGVLTSALAARLSLFTTISTLGLSLGVAALMVVLAVTSGFQRDYLGRISSFQAHLVVGVYGEPGYDQAMKELRSLEIRLRDLPGVVRIDPFANSAAEVMIGGTAANLRAVDPTRAAASLARSMTAGDPRDLGRPAFCPVGDELLPVPPIVLGSELGRKARARPGQCIDVLVPVLRQGGFDLESVHFKVVGLASIGLHNFDARYGYLALADVRRIESARPFIYGVELEWEDPFDALDAEPAITARVGQDYRVLDWTFLGQNLFEAVTTQRTVIFVFLFIIILVSAINLLASLYLVVIAKSREIAILSAMGARRSAVMRIFVTAGGVSGLMGIAGGLLLGLFVCGLLRVYRYPLDAVIYQVGELPVRIVPADLVLVAGVAQLACLLATIPAARRLARLHVVEGLRQV